VTPLERALAAMVAELISGAPFDWQIKEGTASEYGARVNYGAQAAVGDLVYCSTIGARSPFPFVVGIVEAIHGTSECTLRALGGSSATCRVSNEMFLVIRRKSNLRDPFLFYTDRQLKLTRWVDKALLVEGVHYDLRVRETAIVDGRVRAWLRPHAFCAPRGSGDIGRNGPSIDIPDHHSTRLKDVCALVRDAWKRGATDVPGWGDSTVRRFDWTPFFAEAVQ